MLVDADEFGGELGTLVADVGDCDDFPERGAGERAHGEQASRWNAVATDDRAIGAGLDADAERIDASQALVEEAEHGWIGGGARIPDDAGTIDDGANLHALGSTLAASPVVDPSTGFVKLDADHLCREQSQSSGINRMRDAGLRLRRHAVTMHVPPGARMLEEATFRGKRKIAPKPLTQPRNQRSNWLTLAPNGILVFSMRIGGTRRWGFASRPRRDIAMIGPR